MSLERLSRLEPGRGPSRARGGTAAPERPGAGADRGPRRAARPAATPAPQATSTRRRPADDTTAGGVVRHGPAAYRRRLHRLGPLAGLTAPLLLLAATALIRGAGTPDGLAGAKTIAGTWVLILLALPTSTLCGLPWTTGGAGLRLALATSALVWLAVGLLAARRATRSSPVATWREWGREYALLVVAVWAGSLAGLGAIGWVLTHGS